MISPNRECSSFPIKIKIDKADVGLENVDNTADLDKPISNAVRDYLDGAKDSVSTNVALAKEYSDNAKASETNCETIEAKIEALNVATVDTAQNITGAKTFAGETTITGPLGVSGDTALSGKVTVEKELNVDSNGVATLNGTVTASNTGNSIKVANHDTALVSNDVLSAKDINTPNGDANNLLHRSGDESKTGNLTLEGASQIIRHPESLGSINKENILMSVIDDAQMVFMRDLLIYLMPGSLINRKYLRLIKDNKTIMAYLDLSITSDGSVSLTLLKTVDGVETERQVIAKLA